jgi:hypothetical protein
MSTRISLMTGLALWAALLIPDGRAQFYIGAEAGWTGLPEPDRQIRRAAEPHSALTPATTLAYVAASSGARGASKRNTAIARTAWPTTSGELASPSMGLAQPAHQFDHDQRALGPHHRLASDTAEPMRRWRAGPILSRGFTRCCSRQ